MFGLGNAVVAAFVLQVRTEATVEDVQFGILVEGAQHLAGFLVVLLLQQGFCLLQSDVERIGVFGNADVHLLVLNVRTKSTCAHSHVLAIQLSQCARQTEEFQCFFKGDGLDALIGMEACKTGLLLVVGSSYLSHTAKATNLHTHVESGLGVFAQNAFANAMLVVCVQGLLYLRVEVLVELLHGVGPHLLAFGDVVERLLHIGSEVVVHDGREVLVEEIVDHDACVRRHQFATLGTSGNFLFALLYLVAL